jgi:LacI family transcriptional regulator
MCILAFEPSSHVKNKKLSLNDIAAQLGVSRTTISFVLNGKAKEHRVSDKVVRKIQKFVKETGYQPNAVARSLRTGKTHSIGLMIEDISNPFFATIARLIEDKAYPSGYKIIYCSTDNDPKKAAELIQMFEDRGVDGYIIAAPEGMEKELKALLKKGRPVVLFDRYFPSVDTDYVIINNEDSTFKATRHFIQQGYKKIAFFTLSSTLPQMKARLAGYKAAMQKNKLTTRVKEVAFDLEDKKRVSLIAQYLKEHPDTEAILFGTNYLGVNGLEAIQKVGLNIPDDLAVISFDDHVVFNLSRPSISAISQPVEQIAEEVINTLLSRLTNPNHKKKALEIQASLIIRESSKK